MTSSNNDLNGLISQAETTLAKKKKPVAASPSGGRSPKTLAIATLLLALAAWAWVIWSHSIPDAQIRNDLKILLDSARNGIEQYQIQNGKLPPALPDITLATVVQFQVLEAESTPPKYRLNANIRGVHESWSSFE